MHHSSLSWEITLLYIFSRKFIWFRQKKFLKMQNFILSTAHGKCNQICTLIGFFCWHVYTFHGGKSTEELCLMTLKKKWFVVSKLTNISWILTQAIKGLKNLHFDWFLLYKVYTTFDLKMYRGVIFHDNEGWYKIWKKTDLVFQKWHE